MHITLIVLNISTYFHLTSKVIANNTLSILSAKRSWTISKTEHSDLSWYVYDYCNQYKKKLRVTIVLHYKIKHENQNFT